MPYMDRRAVAIIAINPIPCAKRALHADQEARTVEKKVQAMGLILSSKVLFSAIETI